MRNRKELLDIDFIGGFGSLTKADELKLSDYFKSKKKPQANGDLIKKNSKLKKQKV